MKKEPIIPKQYLDKIEIKNSEIDRKGVFAKKDIKKGEKIIEYVGKRLTKEESDIQADRQLEMHSGNPGDVGEVYIFELNDKYDIDGFVDWNPARFINHSCSPNSETEIEDDKIWIIATEDIKKGEEISYNYGYDFEDYKDHPCKCGSTNCVKYILAEEHWPKIKKTKNIKQSC